MKKQLLILLLMALFTPWAANAQEKSLTVYDGTATNNYVPMYVYYFDDFTRTQFVIPATDLEAMATGEISAITYYTSLTSAYTTASEVDIYVAEVADASISDFINKEDATIVYQGTVDFVLVDGKCQATITFPRPYTYNGGNLLIGCDNTTDEGYKNIYFYGQSVTGASVAGSNPNGLAGVTASQQNFIPKTTFTYTGGITLTCFRPENLQATAVSTTTATLVWEDESVDPEWTLQYSTSNTFAEGTYTEMSVADAPTANLTNLTPSTTYYARVKPNCDTEGNKWSTIATFITECEAITTYPWTENFDSYTGVTSGTTNNLPVCWNYINTTTYSSYKGYPVIYSASGYSNSGNNHLRFYTYYSSNISIYDPQDQYAILPEMESLNGKQLSLFARGANANSSFKVGLMTDPTDVSTFVEIATTTPTTGYVEYTYNLTGTGNYIAIMIEAANSTATSRTVYIDDITIDLPPACPKPTDLIVVENSVTAHTVQLSWVSEATSWEICLNGDEEHPIPANTNPFTLTGLTEATAYTAKVRAVCDGTPGEWSNSTVSFTTPIACPAPTGLAVSGTTGSQTTLNWTGNSDSYDVIYRTAFYVDGFYEPFNANAIPDGWTKYSGLVDNVVAGTATLTTTTSGWNTNTYALGTYNMKVNVYGSMCKYWIVTPEFNLIQNMSFDLALTDYGNADPIEDPTAQADDRFVVLIYADGAWTNLREWNNTGSEYVYNTIATTGENVTIDLSAYQGKNVKIAFYAESTVSGGDNDLHIDNVICGIPHEAGEWQTAVEGVTETTYTLTGLSPETDYDVKVLSNCEGETGHEAMVSFTTEAACMVPSELALVSATTTSAVLTWTSTSTAWQIQVDEENPIDVTENPYTVEGLTHSTIYTFKVRAYCSDGTYTEWSEPMNFATECDVVTTYPWEENFDEYSTIANSTTTPSTYPNDVLPICWQFLNRSTTSNTYPQVFLSAYSAYAVSGNCLFLKSSNTTPLYAILPQFDEDIAGLQLNFTYRNEGISSSNGTLIVGYMTDPADATSFTAVDTCAQTYSKTEVEVLFNGAPTGSYIAFMYQGGSSNNYYLSIDNVIVTLAPTCLKPTDLAAVATVNSATLSWMANSEETEWTIYYREVTNEPGEYIEVSGVTDNPYLLDNVLEASTQYEFYVVANCSADDASEPSEVMSFYTKCDPVTEFPWTEDFEDYDASSTGVTFSDPCWENIHLAGTGAYFFEVYSGTNGTNTTNQLRLHDMAAGTMTKLTLPGMTLPDDNYEFVIDVYRSSSYTNKPDEGIRVYASTDGEIEGATELAFIPRVYSVESGVIPAEEIGNAWYTYHLPIGFSGTCYIILRGESQFGTATYMDNFEVKSMISKVFTDATNNGLWSVDENWDPEGVPTMDDNVFITVPVTIPDGCVAVANKVTCEDANATVTIEDGGQFQYNGTGLIATVEKNIAGYGDSEGGYYLLSNPVKDDQDITTTGLITDGIPFDLYYFDQSQELEWINYEDTENGFTLLLNGVGYLYANEIGVSPVRFTGELNPTNDVIDISLNYVSSAEFPGFNLIGNPFTCNAYLAEGRDFYVITEGEEGSEIRLAAADETVIEPMQGVFVIAGEDGEIATFTTSDPNQDGRSIDLRLIGTRGNDIDLVRVRFGHGNNLRKMQLNPNHTKVYIPQGNDDFAVAVADSEQGELPINFKAEKNGVYTLTIPTLNSQLSTLNFKYLHLIDNLTGNDVDLLETPSYTFDAKHTDYASRFKLVFSANSDEEAFAFISDGNLIMNADAHGASLQIVDMMGHILYNGNATRTVSTKGMASGVYVLRMINGNNVKTQKIVIE